MGPDNKVQLRPINIGRDYGTTLEILGGVSPTDQIVVNPADSLEDGQQVNVAQPQTKPAAARSSAARPAERRGVVKRAGHLGRFRAARTCRRMHCRSALQPACGSGAGAGCVEDATAMAAGRAQGFNSQRRVVESL